MSAIYRKSVQVKDQQELLLTGPPISVAADRGGRSDVFDLWFEHVDDIHASAQESRYAIFVFGTGHPVPWTRYTRHAYRFLGTVVTPSELVWHVFRGPLPGQPVGV